MDFGRVWFQIFKSKGLEKGLGFTFTHRFPKRDLVIHLIIKVFLLLTLFIQKN